MKPRALSESALALRYEKAVRRGANHDARLRGLGKLARAVFVDRNAHGWNKPGMPKGERLAVKAEVRPFLRETIHWVRKSRDALRSGDMQMHELLRDRARMYHAFAMLEFFQPAANRYGEGLVRFAGQAQAGGKVIAGVAAKKHAELDRVILSCLVKGEKTREYAKEWQQSYRVSADTVERRIKAVKAKLARR